MDAVLDMLRSKRVMTELSFTPRSLTAATKPSARVGFICKCQAEGHEKHRLRAQVDLVPRRRQRQNEGLAFTTVWITAAQVNKTKRRLTRIGFSANAQHSSRAKRVQIGVEAADGDEGGARFERLPHSIDEDKRGDAELLREMKK